jgi:hypothetical protein
MSDTKFKSEADSRFGDYNTGKQFNTVKNTSHDSWVRNVGGTSDDKNHHGGSWIKHYEYHTGQSREEVTCYVKDCSKPVSHGAHVKSEKSDSMHLKPSCSPHNSNRNEEYRKAGSTTKSLKLYDKKDKK